MFIVKAKYYNKSDFIEKPNINPRKLFIKAQQYFPKSQQN